MTLTYVQIIRLQTVGVVFGFLWEVLGKKIIIVFNEIPGYCLSS